MPRTVGKIIVDTGFDPMTDEELQEIVDNAADGYVYTDADKYEARYSTGTYEFDVKVYDEAGNEVTTYREQHGDTAHDSPKTTSSTLTLHVAELGNYKVSVRHDAVEVARRGGRLFRCGFQHEGQAVTFAPDMDTVRQMGPPEVFKMAAADA